MTKGMLGGMTGPIVEAEEMIAVQNLRSKPLLVIPSNPTVPMAAASATAAPVIPAKIMALTTMTWPSPPLKCPTKFCANRNRRFVIPPAFMRLPVRMKKGMARRVKLVVLEYILAGTMHKTLVSPSATKKMTAVKPMAMAMGSPIMMKNINTPKMAAVIMAFSFLVT
jgi:hypothetical protein